MKKIMLLAASMAVLMASCQSEEQAAVIASDEALVSFGMDFSVEDAALTRAAHSFDYYVAVSAEAPIDGSITSGYVGRFTSLVEASVVLQKGTTYNFYISAFENAGAEYDLSTYCATSGEFVEVTSATPVAPDFADTRVDRYYGSTSEEIVNNTTISVEGKRFAYGINVNIETPLEGKVVMSSESPAFTYTVTSSDDAKVENNIFCLAGVDEDASKEATVTVKWYDASNIVISTVNKTITVVRNHMKTLKVKASDPNVGFDFSDDEDDVEDDGEEEIEIDLYNGHEYVDLGLSVKWATCNIGTDKVGYSGWYFGWGDINDDPKHNNYSRFWSSRDDEFSKYNSDPRYGTPDNKFQLDPEDDAAHVLWGGVWRMPTKEELDELVNECTWEYNTTDYTRTGFVVTGKNGNSIFLPTTGKASESGIANYAFCYYWSSTLSESSPFNAYMLETDYKKAEVKTWGRSYGMNIRPVCK